MRNSKKNSNSKCNQGKAIRLKFKVIKMWIYKKTYLD